MREYIKIIEDSYDNLSESHLLTANPDLFWTDIYDGKVRTGMALVGNDFEEPDDMHDAYEYIVNDIVAAQKDIAPLVKNGSILIHRALSVTSDWIDHLKPGTSLGEYWSYEYSGAVPHAGSRDANRVILVISGLVSEDDVDWEITIAVHASGEREIRVFDGSEIAIVSMNILTKSAVLPWTVRKDLNGKVFIA